MVDLAYIELTTNQTVWPMIQLGAEGNHSKEKCDGDVKDEFNKKPIWVGTLYQKKFSKIIDIVVDTFYLEIN